jgi:hypothetical protein
MNELIEQQSQTPKFDFNLAVKELLAGVGYRKRQEKMGYADT